MRGLTAMKIVIKSMSLDGHDIPVPVGLSELINRAGAWSTDEIPPPDGYQCSMKRINGRLVTEFVYVADKTSAISLDMKAR